MKVILHKDISKLGKKYDVKDVADGYAMNFLIPKGGAEVATEGALKKLDGLKTAWLAEAKIQEDLLEKNLHEVEGKTVVIKAKASEQGHLFAGIHKEDLVDAIKTQVHGDIIASFIDLPKPIKTTGDHEILIKANGKEAKLTVSVENK